MPTTFKLFADKMGGRAASAYIGTEGEIFYDPTTTTLRISDGINAGGNEYAMGTGGGTSNRLVNGTSELTLGTNGDISLPVNGGIVFDRANTSIRVGMGFHIASGEGIDIQAIDETDPDNLIYKNWYFGTDGVLTLPGVISSLDGIALNTSRGSVLFGANLEAPGLPSHYHISKATDNFDLFFGDDSNYVELPQGGGLVISTNNSTNGQNLWQFGTDGAVAFPTLTVPISDNTNPNGTGQTLKFRDVSQQAIIYGPESTVDVISAQRIIIQGAPGHIGTAGEGGDVYLWAGPGGSADGGGGDIKVRAGQGQGAGGGGYLNFQAGDSAAGAGGYINIESGEALTGQGGYVDIRARSGGDVNLYTGQAGKITLNTEGGAWVFGADSISTFPGAVSANTIEGRSVTQIGTQWAYATNYLGGADNEGSQGVNLAVEPETLAMLAAWESNHIVPWAIQFSGEAPVEVVLMTNYGDRIQVATATATFHALPVVISSGDYQAAIPTSVVLKAATNSWTFGADGLLTFPDASTQAGGALPLAQLKTIVAAATSWTDFQTAIAAL